MNKYSQLAILAQRMLDKVKAKTFDKPDQTEEMFIQSRLKVLDSMITTLKLKKMEIENYDLKYELLRHLNQQKNTTF